MKLRGHDLPSEVQLSDWESRIAANPDTAPCLHALTPVQCTQLAALMGEIVADLQHRAAADKEALTRLGKRKLQTARRALEDFLKLGESPPRQAAAREFLRRLDESNKPERTGRVTQAVQPSTRRLHDFFNLECGLSQHESEVRVARLRNTFWSEFGIKKVPYREEYRKGQSKGCDAVQACVLRSKKSKSR